MMKKAIFVTGVLALMLAGCTGKAKNAERAVNDLEQKIQKGKNLPGKSE